MKERLGIVPEVTAGGTGQFDVMVDGQQIAERGGNVLSRILLGAGFPDLTGLVDEIERRASGAAGAG